MSASDEDPRGRPGQPDAGAEAAAGAAGAAGAAPGDPPPVEPRAIDQWVYEFVAHLAHDMRTPLGAILMWAHVLRTGQEADRDAALDAIEASARAQSKMIADLVDISRAVMGRLAMERKPVDLVRLLGASVAALMPYARSRGVAVDLSLPDEAGAAGLIVMGDAKRLAQIVSNLVAHGIRFSNDPRAGAEARLARVLVTLTGNGAGAELIVRDTGCGLEAEELAQIFTPYRTTTDPDRDGPHDASAAAPDFGLGLAFAHRLVSLHGGVLRAESLGAGTGTTFTLRLPLAPPAATTPG